MTLINVQLKRFLCIINIQLLINVHLQRFQYNINQRHIKRLLYKINQRTLKKIPL